MSNPFAKPSWEPTVISDLKVTISDADMWVWEPYIERSEKVLFAAQPKCGKTTLITNVISAMADGGHLIGDIHPGKVLLLTEERIRQWMLRHKKLGLEDNLSIVTGADVRGLDFLQICNDLAYHAYELKAHLVIIDSYLRFNDATDENDSAQMQAAANTLNIITDNDGPAVMVIHHLRKSSGSHWLAVRGSNATPAAFDVLMALDYGTGSTERILMSDGRRDDVPRPEEPKHIALVNGRYETRSQSQEAKHQLVVIRVLTEAASPITQPEILKAWPDGARKVGKTSLKNIMKAGVADRDFTVTGKGVSGNPFRYELAEVGQSSHTHEFGADRPNNSPPLVNQEGSYSVGQPQTQGVGETGRLALGDYHHFNQRMKSVKAESKDGEAA